MLTGIAKVLQGMGKMFDKAGKAITPKTIMEKGKEIGIDIDKLKLGDKKLVNQVLNKLGFKQKSTLGGKLIKGGAAAGAGSAATLGAQKFAGDVKEELEKNLKELVQLFVVQNLRVYFNGKKISNERITTVDEK